MTDYDPAENSRKSYDVAIDAMREKLASFRCERVGDATLYLGDCREILPLLPKVDAVVTDPPYGIGVDATMHKQSGSKHGKAAAAKRSYDLTDWDSSPPDKELIDLLLSKAGNSILFGGNYFELPPSRCWLVWDKENGGNAFADAEMAWTNLEKPVRLKRHLWNGMLRKGGEERGPHPTQKPLEVMVWCLEQLPRDSVTILDPFMGSGTTGVACAKLGRKFIGIELEQKYFDIAVKRIDDAYRQPRLFKDEPPKPKQEALL